MARASTCLNAPRESAAAFEFCRSVPGGEFNGGMRRPADMPTSSACTG